MSSPDKIQNMFAKWTQTCLLFMKIILTSDKNHLNSKNRLTNYIFTWHLASKLK